MTKKIYKYIGPDILDVAFDKEYYCGFKFSYPKDYNDPYELFLTINFEDDREVIAFYNEVVRDIQQFPTTCFSSSPIVTPMWAHYAHNSKGFVIEIDEEKLLQYLKDANLEDVVYQDKPREELTGTFNMAYRRGKPRDMMFLRNGVQNAAYFTKHSCWDYESERRLVVSMDDVSIVNENMIAYIPIDCVTSIISGSLTKPLYKEKAKEVCNEIDSRYLEAKIGRSSSDQYFIDEEQNTYTFNENNIVACKNYCDSCKEPIQEYKEFCSWCLVTEEDMDNAAANNPLRMLAEMGTLENYIRGFNRIGK